MPAIVEDTKLVTLTLKSGIVTFRDDPALKKGQEISSGLLDAIRDLKMFVLIISENYARSPWCLKELVEILSCKKTENQKKRYSPEMIDEWKSSLAQIAVISGYHLKKEAKENESETIQSIVEIIARKVSTKVVHVGEELFGIDFAVHVEEVKKIPENKIMEIFELNYKELDENAKSIFHDIAFFL
ncbi:hypothetical protein AgCh_014843 [Apium graveolens]